MSEKRRLLEVLKWVPPEDNLCSTSTVCRQWLAASNDDEVWVSFSHDYDMTPLRPENQSYKEGFHEQLGTMLAMVTKLSLEIYNCRSKTTFRKLSFLDTLHDDYSIAVVLLAHEDLVACGGQQSRQSYYISSSGSVTHLKQMMIPREFHSAALLNQALYVFGGDNSSDHTAEYLQVEPIDSEREWQLLPDSLLSHAACQPCVHSSLIYLCGGNNSKSEVFDAANNEYSLLPFTLPESLYGCVSFFRKGELILFTQNNVSRWRPGSEIQSSPNSEECSGIWTSTAQVLYQNCLFSAERGQVRVFDLAQGKRISLPQ